MKKVIVLGVGNLLLKDEGVGIQAVQRLMEEVVDPEVELIDGGTSGLDLLPIFERCENLFIIDCVKGGGEPGAIYKFDSSDIEKKVEAYKMSVHDFDLVDTIELARALEKKMPQITVYGVEPSAIEWGLELTSPVKLSLKKLVALVKKDIERILRKNKKGR